MIGIMCLQKTITWVRKIQLQVHRSLFFQEVLTTLSKIWVDIWRCETSCDEWFPSFINHMRSLFEKLKSWQPNKIIEKLVDEMELYLNIIYFLTAWSQEHFNRKRQIYKKYHSHREIVLASCLILLYRTWGILTVLVQSALRPIFKHLMN